MKKPGVMVEVDEYIKLKLVHSLHNSEIRSHEACPRRWDWLYRQGYYPKVTPKPLEFGSAWHAALEVWYDPDMWRRDRDTMRELTVSKFFAVIRQQLADYKELNGTPSDEVMQDYTERGHLGEAMIRYYTERISPKLDVGLTPLTVEIKFEVPMDMWCKCQRCWKKYNAQVPDPEPDHHLWQGLPVTFGGRIDAIFQDLEGRLWVFDWKSTVRILDNLMEASFLQLDTQVGRYPMALARLGRPTDGFIYHEQRKAVPEPPDKLVRLYKGRQYSTSKSQNTDYDTFVQTIQDDHGYHAGLYDDFLDFLKSEDAPKFFQRHKIIKNKHELQITWDELKQEAERILYNPPTYHTPSRFECNGCAFKVPCIGKNMGEDYQYTLDTLFDKREKHYYEEDRRS